MKIDLKTPYKSLQPFMSEDLGDLIIITGKNGSGKSQLLDILDPKKLHSVRGQKPLISVYPSYNRIQSEGIIKMKSKSINFEEWKNILNTQISVLNNYKSTSFFKFIKFIEENSLSKKIGFQKDLLSDTNEYKDILAQLYFEATNSTHSSSSIRRVHEDHVFGHYYNADTLRLYGFIKEICRNTGKKEEEITDSDFYTTPLNENLIDKTDLFLSEIETIFFNYARRRDLNNRSYFDKIQYGDKNNSIPDDEFIKEFTPPWILINNIFFEHKLDFIFKGVDKRDFTTDIEMSFYLSKKSSGKLIPFEDLSSGEKVIIGIILKLFISEYYGKEMTFPELIILDEPDAHLHPEMSKLLLDVLEITFVKKMGIKIIMTTHSPSTIALAPEDCIYELKNGNESGLKKINKDEALQILTSFIPTLSIDYKNHKQVFLESPTDVEYFQNLHNRHKQKSSSQNNLYFISNSYGKGNCSQVYKIVREIRNSGNKTSYGIVDWDLKNKPEKNIHVHGFEERYSVENFILDPLYIICLLMDMKNAHNICQSLDLEITYNQFSIGDEDESRLQEMVKFYFEKFEDSFSTYKYSSKKIQIEYLNGKVVEVPKWYLEMQGHEIVTKIKKIFTALQKFKSEGELQNALSLIITKCYPFVPLLTIELIEKILNDQD